MSLPIEDMGGLTEGEIDKRILISQRETGRMLDEKIGALKTSVDARLDKQDGQIGEILSIVRTVKSNGDEWHAEDLTYRAGIEKRIGRVEAILKTLRVWINAIQAFKAAKTAVVYVTKEGKQVSIAIAAVTGVWLTVMNFIHVVWPLYVHPYIVKHWSH